MIGQDLAHASCNRLTWDGRFQMHAVYSRRV